MGKKKDEKLKMLTVEYQSLNERMRQAREELGYIEHNKMRIKRDLKQIMKRQREIEQKRGKISGDVACCAPY